MACKGHCHTESLATRQWLSELTSNERYNVTHMLFRIPKYSLHRVPVTLSEPYQNDVIVVRYFAAPRSCLIINVQGWDQQTKSKATGCRITVTLNSAWALRLWIYRVMFSLLYRHSKLIQDAHAVLDPTLSKFDKIFYLQHVQYFVT